MTTTTSLANDAPTSIDARAAFAQINLGDSWRLTRLGARNQVCDERAGYIQFDVTLDRRYRVIVKLAADDTYAVEIGRNSVRTYQVLAQTRGIYCDELGEFVERMCLAVEAEAARYARGLRANQEASACVAYEREDAMRRQMREWRGHYLNVAEVRDAIEETLNCPGKVPVKAREWVAEQLRMRLQIPLDLNKPQQDGLFDAG